MKKVLGILVLGLLLSGCAGEVGDKPFFGIQPGQWTTPREAGENKWMTSAWSAGDAITGGTKFCEQRNKKLETIDLKPHDGDAAAVLIFSCY